MLDYGVSFLQEFAPVRRNHKHGAFITSCICHNCPFDKLSLQGKPAYAHYAAWYHGRTSGGDAITVDPRLPNANGTIPYHTIRRRAATHFHTEVKWSATLQFHPSG